MRVSETSVDIDGRQMVVQETGPVDGVPVLLVHGFPLNHAMWQNQIQGLDPPGNRFRVLCPDLMGCGSSGPIDGETSMQQIADQLAAMLEQLQVCRPVVFCGLSMRGYVGWQFLQHHRDKVSHLIACNTRAAADSQIVARGRRQIAISVLQTGTAPIAASLPEKLFALRTAVPGESAPGKSAEYRLIENTIARTDPDTIAKLQRAMADRPDATPMLNRVVVPTLVIAGECDVITPPDEMRTMAAQITGAKFACIAGVGHLTPLEDGPAFNALVTEFLAGVGSGEAG